MPRRIHGPTLAYIRAAVERIIRRLVYPRTRYACILVKDRCKSRGQCANSLGRHPHAISAGAARCCGFDEFANIIYTYSTRVGATCHSSVEWNSSMCLPPRLRGAWWCSERAMLRLRLSSPRFARDTFRGRERVCVWLHAMYVARLPRLWHACAVLERFKCYRCSIVSAKQIINAYKLSVKNI